ncbi:hypothetical protein Hanom_Chr00s000001g01596041 [Helianthus anomalus]
MFNILEIQCDKRQIFLRSLILPNNVLLSSSNTNKQTNKPNMLSSFKQAK